MTPDDDTRLFDRARRLAADHDADVIRAGRELLEHYRGPGMTTRDAFRAYMHDLMDPEDDYPASAYEGADE